MKGTTMRVLLFALLALASPAAATETAPCAAQVTRAFTPSGAAHEWTIDAFAYGARSCRDAMAVVAIRNDKGDYAYSATWPTQGYAFQEVTDQPSLGAALTSWIAQDGPAQTTADLPAWPEDADAPMQGEFPFIPTEGIDRAAYLELRAAAKPVFWYVPGMESAICIVIDPATGSATFIGRQNFPG